MWGFLSAYLYRSVQLFSVTALRLSAAFVLSVVFVFHFVSFYVSFCVSFCVHFVISLLLYLTSLDLVRQ